MSKHGIFSSRGAFAVAAAGFLGWFGGSAYEKYKITFNSERYEYDVYNGIVKYPALPIFGTVSAATAIKSSKDVESSVTAVANRTGEIMKYGFPSLDQVRSFDDFVLSYDRKTRVANWVFEHLSADRLKVTENVDRAKCEFTEDISIHPYFRANNKDYKGSGFDRGHLAAAGNHRLAQRHCDQTFILSNISPQVGVGFNRDSWNRLEKYVRKLTRTYPNVYVCTGPLFLPRKEVDGKSYVRYQVIGENQVAVPTHFFKIVVMETENRELHLEAYVMSNQPIPDSTPLSSFMVPPDSIERHAGLLFFDRLSRDKLVKVNGRKSTYV